MGLEFDLSVVKKWGKDAEVEGGLLEVLEAMADYPPSELEASVRSSYFKVMKGFGELFAPSC